MNEPGAAFAAFAIVDVPLENGVQDGVMAKGLVDTSSRQNPIVVDFLSSKLRHRIKNGADGEAVVKTLGVKSSERQGVTVYDFTAGLGTEAYLLAVAGFSVVAFERDPRVFELLEDGLKRWRSYEEAMELSPLQLEFRFGDAGQWVRDQKAAGKIQKVYAAMLDPMFEGEAIEGKSAPKKEMATLRRMLTPSSDVELTALFHAAFDIAEGRVIVKRPDGAPDLASSDSSGRTLKPARRLEGKTARFDIYSCR